MTKSHTFMIGVLIGLMIFYLALLFEWSIFVTVMVALTLSIMGQVLFARI